MKHPTDSTSPSWEPVEVLLQGGPHHGVHVFSLRVDGLLAEYRACFTDRGTAAIYRPTRRDDDVPTPIFDFDHEVPLRGHASHN